MPLDTAKLREVVVTAIAKAAEVEPGTIHDDLDLFDLGLDSLNFAGILIDIEDAIGAEIPAEVLDRFLDIGDVVTIRDVVGLLSGWDPGANGDAGSSPYGEVVVIEQP
jgi:acyl carrier protein